MAPTRQPASWQQRLKAVAQRGCVVGRPDPNAPRAAAVVQSLPMQRAARDRAEGQGACMSEIPRIRSPSQVWAGIHAHDAAGPSGGSTGPSRLLHPAPLRQARASGTCQATTWLPVRAAPTITSSTSSSSTRTSRWTLGPVCSAPRGPRCDSAGGRRARGLRDHHTRHTESATPTHLVEF